MGSFKKLNRYFKKYKWAIVLGTVFLIGANFFLVWIPILVGRIVDEIQHYAKGVDNVHSLTSVLFGSHAGWVLAKHSLYLVGAACLYGILLFATRQTLIVSSRKIEFDLRNDVFNKLLQLPQKFYSSFTYGEVYVRATEDITKVREYFGPAYMYTINTLSRAGFIITTMILISPRLTFWALLPLPFLSLFAYWVSGYINKYSRIIQEQYSTLSGRAQETFSGIRLIKAYNREDYEQKRFEKESERYRKKKLRLAMLESMFHPTLNFLIGLSVIIVIWKAGVLVMDNTLTVGNIFEFVVYVAYLTWPIASLGFTVNRFQRSMASWNRINRVLNEPVSIKDNKNTEQSVQDIKGRIEFKDVWFRYEKSGGYAVKNLNLVIEQGQNAAIVGRTGAGKSSLVQLIPRLYDPDKGHILIDGNPITEIPLNVLRKNIGMVPQDTFLFSSSINENIAFGTIEATSEQIERAAEKAQVKENILEFDKKFETMLGERGITLSGGQKQRLAIARALIRDPNIIILDDSLSAVDTKTEEAILQHLRNELKGRTTIMISHRISTIKDADIIFYLEEGTLVEQGTHAELLEKEGRYASMYKKQLIEQELAEI